MGFMAYLGAVMTLPGIAGFILTIGMGVDSNVLIFERIREELAAKKGARQAVAAGFDRVFSTIVDTHVASLIAAAFLFQFGTGPIRGFATTLFFGLLANVFTAVFVSRTLFEFDPLAPARRRDPAEHLTPGAAAAMRILHQSQLQLHQVALARASSLSVAVIGAGLVTIISRGGLPLGVDFSGGTVVVSASSTQPTRRGRRPRRARAARRPRPIVQRFGEPPDNDSHGPAAARPGPSRATSLEADAKQVEAGAAGGQRRRRSASSARTSSARPSARTCSSKGIWATHHRARRHPRLHRVPVPVRRSRVGAIVATLHDVLVTLAFLTWFGYDLSLNVVAAILTITGYSVNDTIVIFDRVRENQRIARGASRSTQIVNKAVNQTLSRTIITAGTTFLAVLALFLFGGEVLRGFAFTMLVGIVTGTYSTVFIASAIAILLSRRGGSGGAQR